MFHRNFFGSSLLFLAIFSSNFFFFSNCLADDDSLFDRNRHACRRNTKFYFKKDLVRHLVGLNAEYDSDEDSKQKLLKLDHYYKSNRFVSDTELVLDTIYEIQRQKNSSSKSKYLIKERDLYRFITSQKLLLFNTNNYVIFFNETRHDNESDYAYRDIVSSAGIGRTFFNQMFEFDISFRSASDKF